MTEEQNPNITPLDKLAQLLVGLFEHHQAEWNNMQVWQVVAQDQIKSLREQVEALLKIEAERGERIDKLIAAIEKRSDQAHR